MTIFVGINPAELQANKDQANGYLGADSSGKLKVPAIPGALSPDVLMPWDVPINPLTAGLVPASKVGTWTLTVSASELENGVLTNSTAAALNDSIGFNSQLAAGTWSLVTIFARGASYGEVTIELDGTPIGSLVDLYDSVSAFDFQNIITGLVVPTTGKHVLTYTVTAKNGSSTNYLCSMSDVQWHRTA